MPNKEPLVSVIMPTFNINQTELALQSILNQDYHNKEVIVINDNPILKISPEIIQLIKKHKIKLINNPKNLGIARSLNRGIKASKSEFILIFCDDYFTKNKQWIKHSIEKLSEKDIGHVICTIDTKDDAWKKYPFFLKLFTFRLIITRSTGGGVSYKKDVFRTIGLFDWKTFRFAGEDGDMYHRMKETKYKTKSINDSITHCHFHENGDIFKAIKKEYHYGWGHGARRKKYGERLGIFDFDIRLLLFFGCIIGLFFNYWVSFFSFLPLFFGAFKQSLNPYSKTKWLPGLLLYPFIGVFIFLIQTIGAIEGYLTTKEDKYNQNIEYLE